MTFNYKPWADVRNMPRLNGVALAFHGGSRVMCNPPPSDTDDDYIVLVHSGSWAVLIDELKRDGWILGGSDFLHTAGDSMFQSYTKGDVNLILTGDTSWYQKMLLATKTCMAINLLDKRERIIVFQAIVYGNAP
jgi:hypothetical protein